MSLGQVLFMGLIVAPTVILGIAFFVLTALLVVSFILDMADELCPDDLMFAMFAIFLALFLAWFVLGFPTRDDLTLPHDDPRPVVDGRRADD